MGTKVFCCFAVPSYLFLQQFEFPLNSQLIRHILTAFLLWFERAHSSYSYLMAGRTRHECGTNWHESVRTNKHTARTHINTLEFHWNETESVTYRQRSSLPLYILPQVFVLACCSWFMHIRTYPCYISGYSYHAPVDSYCISMHSYCSRIFNWVPGCNSREHRSKILHIPNTFEKQSRRILKQTHLWPFPTNEHQ